MSVTLDKNSVSALLKVDFSQKSYSYKDKESICAGSRGVGRLSVSAGRLWALWVILRARPPLSLALATWLR